MLNSGQNRWFFLSCEIEIWWITLKNKGHLLNATSSFVHHFVAIDEFKMELESRKA